MDTNTSTLEQLTALASKQLGLAAEQIGAATSFTELGLDSLSLVDFMFAVEDHYRLSIDHDAALAQPTLAGLAVLVDRLLAERKPAEAL